jgi:hypothetical protein
MIIKVGPLKFEHIHPTGYWVNFDDIVVEHKIIGSDKLTATFHAGPISVTFNEEELEGMHQVNERYKKEGK